MKEVISHRQAVSLLTVFLLGSSIIIGVSSEAGQDSWISQLLSSAMAIPVVMIYARLIRLFPGKNIFEMLNALFGKIWGKALSLLMTWYALHLGALVVNNFAGFIKTVTMPETPLLPIMLLFVLVAVFMIKSGIETLGKWTLIVLPIVMSVVLFTTILSLRQMDFTNILPVFSHGLGDITATAYKSLTFPYAETVIFLCAADAVRKTDSPYRIYLYGLLLCTSAKVIIILRNIELIGPALMQALYFPSFVAARLIKIGDFLQRIEGTISMIFILAGTAKTSVCVLAAAKGTAALFNIKSYRQLVVPVALLVLAVSAIAFENMMEMFGFMMYYQYYAMPFQFGIPIVLWITAELKKERIKNAEDISEEG